MSKFIQRLVNFAKREDGPTAVEYAIMLSLIVMLCVSAIRTLGSNSRTTSSKAGNAVSVAS